MTQEQYDLERMRAWTAVACALISSGGAGIDGWGEKVTSASDLFIKNLDSRFSPNQGKKEEA